MSCPPRVLENLSLPSAESVQGHLNRVSRRRTVCAVYGMTDTYRATRTQDRELTSSTPPNKTEIVELGYLILENSR